MATNRRLKARSVAGLLTTALAGVLLFGSEGCATQEGPGSLSARPNILFAISDDQSWLHTGAAGDPNVKTPAFDRVAREGILFTHAFTAAPSCTPSRSAVLTGQAIWRLEDAGLLMGTIPTSFDVFPLMLEEAGYQIGYTGKGWGPGDYRAAGRTRYPIGQEYNERQYDSVPPGIRNTDYAANFEEFLKARSADRPFLFWFGASEPHRSYAKGAGLEAGKETASVKVPAFLPDTEEIRSDILDYYVEIEWFDSHLGRILEMLAAAGELDNTLVVVTSDNGMPFPRAKTTLYDWGTRMPLAIRWPPAAVVGRTVEDFVSHTDFAPTFLEAAGIEIPAMMTGRSLLPILTSDLEGRVDPSRGEVFTAIERHTWTRPRGAPYPSRAIRTHEYLYVRNFEPDRWPAGDPEFDAEPQGVYGDVDRCPTKTFMLEAPNVRKYPREFELSFGKRPAEELYDVAQDPGQVNNLADSVEHAAIKKQLRAELERRLAETKDPRSEGRSPWDEYAYRRRGMVKRPAK